MKKIIVLAVLALLLSTSAFAQTWTWDFNDGTFQGWQILGRNTGHAAYVAPVNAINPTNGTGSMLVLANRDSGGWGNQMIFRLSDLGLSNVNKFKYSANVRYDLLTQMWNAGIQYGRGTGTGSTGWFEGRGSDTAEQRDNLQFKDASMVSNYTQRWEDAFKTPTGHQNGISNLYMEIDYNVAVEGRVTVKFMAYDFNSLLAGGSNILWQATHDRDISKDAFGEYLGIDYLKFGGEYGHTNGWYYDDVTFTVVPEPGTFVALGSGLVGLVGFAIRRRK